MSCERGGRSRGPPSHLARPYQKEPMGNSSLRDRQDDADQLFTPGHALAGRHDPDDPGERERLRIDQLALLVHPRSLVGAIGDDAI